MALTNSLSWLDKIRKDLSTKLNNPSLGIFLLVIAFLVGYLYRYAGSFSSDEGDKLAIGLLMQRGSLPYRDVFTHHFPFPYFWSFLVVKFLPSIQAVRISVVLTYLLAFGLAMWITRYYLAVGLLAVIWSIIGHYYYGNLAIYNMFSGVALSAVFIIAVAVISRNQTMSLRESIAIGVLSAIAVLSDPLAVFPILIAFLFLGLATSNFKRISGTILLFTFLISCFGIYLLITSSVDDFYRDVYFFNTHIYNKYYNANPMRLVEFPRIILNGLSILEPNRWLQREMLIPFESYTYFQKFFIGGFIYRLAVVSLGLLLLTHKKWLLAGFVYTFAAASLIRSEGFFRQIAFVLIAIFCVQYLIFVLLKDDGSPTKIGESHKFNSFWRNLQILSHSIISAILSIFFIWFCLHTLISDLQKPKTFSYAKNLGAYETKTREIRELTCGEEVALGVYPGDPLIYFYTGLQPISRYIYFWPWVAEIGLTEVLDDLRRGSAIVYIDKDVDVWGYQTKVYLAELIGYLDNHYIPKGSFYLSPDLAEACGYPRTGSSD